MTIDNKRYTTGYVCVLAYFRLLATNALLDRHYAQWQEARNA